jgi:hypothetical protein
MQTSGIGNSFWCRMTLLAATAACCSHNGPAQQQNQTPAKFIETVTARAPFDLSCSREEIQVVKLGDSSIGAMGCGRQASYSCICTYHVWYTCTAATCTLDGMGSNSAEPPPVLRGTPPSSQSAVIPDRHSTPEAVQGSDGHTWILDKHSQARRVHLPAQQPGQHRTWKSAAPS